MEQVGPQVRHFSPKDTLVEEEVQLHLQYILEDGRLRVIKLTLKHGMALHGRRAITVIAQEIIYIVLEVVLPMLRFREAALLPKLLT